MFSNLKQSIILTVFAIGMFGFAYPLFIFAIGNLLPEKSIGSPVYLNGKIIGFENIGQNFSDDKYFNGRPSAVEYNAASTGGSNKGPTNPNYLLEVKARIDTFLERNPDVNIKDIPSDLVTASGSGIDPNISPDGAYVQIMRISKIRNITPDKLKELVSNNIEGKYLGIFGIEKLNVLRLNIELDKLK